MRVEVSSILLHDGSVTIAAGVVLADEDEHAAPDVVGRHIRFGGDWRPMREIENALERGETVVVDVEGWQLL